MAFTTAKMGLTVWNLLTDLYDHTQLANNWAKVDYHDHSPGKGVQIPTDGLADGAVTGSKLATALDPSGAYTSAKPIFFSGGQLAGAAAAGTYISRRDLATTTAVPVTAVTSVVYLDPDNWAASGRTVRYSLRGSVITNAVAPTATYAFALFPVATWGGASGAAPTAATIGAAVAGSTTTTIVAPAAAGPSTPVTAEFDAPAAGWYVVGMVQTGAAAANANIGWTNTLFAKQV
jgi:hypothetical protein